VNSFKEFIKEQRGNYLRINPDTGLPRKRRHIDGMFTRPDVKPVPDCHKADNNSVDAYEALNNLGDDSHGEKVITKLEADKLMKKFNITTGSGNLKGTKIHISLHPTKPGFYILKK